MIDISPASRTEHIPLLPLRPQGQGAQRSSQSPTPLRCDRSTHCEGENKENGEEKGRRREAEGRRRNRMKWRKGCEEKWGRYVTRREEVKIKQNEEEEERT